MSQKIDQILECNPNWSELVKAERGYLHVSEPNHVRFVSSSEPGWDDLFKYPLNNEISGAIDTIDIEPEIQEIVVVLEEDADADDPESDWKVSYEVVALPVPIPVPEEA
jgi:hypothetical protein